MRTLLLIATLSIEIFALSPVLKKEMLSTPAFSKKGLDVGVVVTSLKTGETLFDHSGDKLMVPASVAKIFTSYSVLKKLKPTFTFKTDIYTQGVLKDGKLSGDLFLKGGGDPSLVSERMWMLVNELVRSGIKSITGNIVVDASFFDDERTPESRPVYLKDQAYNAPLGALSFNFNTTTIFVRPGDEAGGKPKVFTDPDNAYIDIVNQATTGASHSKNTLTVNRTEFVKGDIGDTVLLRGSIPLQGKEQRFYRNIVNPALYTGHMFRTFWETRGMKLQGNVMEGITPPQAKLVLEYESLPLWQIVWGLNKFSNNFVADQLMKRLGAEVYGPPGTRQKGMQALQATLGEVGIQPGSYEIIDGSGLTRGTHVSARQLVKVLAAIHKDFSISPEFISSLGIAGEDGTLKKRFPNSSLRGVLRAKTGSLDGVNSLAGFAETAGGEPVAFAVILNDAKMKYGSMIPWIDKMVEKIGRFSRK